MAESRSHKIAANRIARKLKTDYSPGKGVDVKSSKANAEVETPETVGQASGQLRGQRRPSFIAGTNQAAVDKTLEVTQGTAIGVMDNKDNIAQPSSRK